VNQSSGGFPAGIALCCFNDLRSLMPRIISAGLRSYPRLRKPAAFRPVVEPLEERQLLSSYYVATNGSDSNVGSLSAPFKTIQKAANTVQPGDTAYIRGGTYRETITVPRSGTSSKPIAFKAYNNEKVVVSGADILTGWSVNSGKVFKANQSWDMGFGNNQIFLDGKMMIEARWPNTTLDVSHPTKATADSGTGGGKSGTIVDADLKAAANSFNGATIWMAPGERWVGQTGSVTSSSYGKLTYTLAGDLSSGNGEAPRAGTPYYLTGKFSMLDSAGEWFRDPSGKTYLWTPGSDNPAGHTVEAKRRLYSFNLVGRSYITLEGIGTFANTINTGSSNHLVISKLDAKYVSQFSRITNGWVQGNRDSGILLMGSDNTLKNSHIQYSAGNGIYVEGDRNIITNNVISDVDYAGTDTAAVRTRGSDIQITWNTMSNAGRSIIKHDASPRLQILHNDLSRGALQTGDAGATYTIGYDGQWTTIAYNRIHDMHTAGKTGATGIYLDRNSTNYLIHHNLVYDCDRAMTLTTPQGASKVYNNTLVGDNYSIANWFLQSAPGTVIRNNIFTSDIRISPGVTISNNLSEGTNPQFVNPANGDYTLKSYSPAINKGMAIANVTEAGITPDLGAFEYGKAAWTAGANLAASTPPVANTPSQPEQSPVAPSGSSIVGKTLQAENFDWNKGLRATNTVLGYADDDDYAKYIGLNFGSGATKITFRYAALHAGGSIQVRLDQWNGPIDGVFSPGATGSWNSFVESTINLSKISGTHNLYFAFKGISGVANIDWFKFS
jgi:hypothetical protein